MEILSRCKKHGIRIWNILRVFIRAQWRRSTLGVMLLWCLLMLYLSGFLGGCFDWLLMNNSERVVFIQTCAFLLPSMVYLMKGKSLDIFLLRPIQRRQFVVVILYSLVIATCSLFLVTLTALVIGSAEDNNVSYVSVVGGSMTEIGLFAGAVFPALCEELLMRGAILTELRPAGRFAALLSGLFFAMLHGSAANFIGPLLAGWIYGVMALHYGSILPAVIAHLIYNTYLLILGQMLMLFTGNDVIFFIYLVNVAILFCSIYGIIIYYEKNQLDTPLWQRNQLPLPDGAWLKKTLISWPFASFCVLFVVRIVSGLM